MSDLNLRGQLIHNKYRALSIATFGVAVVAAGGILSASSTNEPLAKDAVPSASATVTNSSGSSVDTAKNTNVQTNSELNVVSEATNGTSPGETDANVSSNSSVSINGEEHSVPANSSYEKTIINDDGSTTYVKVDSQNNNDSTGSSSSKLRIKSKINSYSSTTSDTMHNTNSSGTE